MEVIVNIEASTATFTWKRSLRGTWKQMEVLDNNTIVTISMLPQQKENLKLIFSELNLILTLNLTWWRLIITVGVSHHTHNKLPDDLGN